MKGNREDQDGTRTRTEEKWKRVLRQSQGEKEMSCNDNKENEMLKGNKRALIIDEGGRVEKGEVQGKRARTMITRMRSTMYMWW